VTDPNRELSDEALCQRVADRDDVAFDLLVQRYQARAYRLAWSILRDAEEARDISQEAFLRLYEGAGSFRGQAKFSTWFYRILVNRCLDHRRKHQWWRRILGSPPESEDESREPLLERHPAPFRDPVDDLNRERVMKQLWVAVDHLSPHQRAALLLQVQEELSTKDIAAVLRCSEATVRVHLHRALVGLRKMLGND